MHQLRVVYQEGQEEKIEGIIVDANIEKTVIKDDNGQLHTVDSEFVTLKKVETENMNEFVIGWLEVLAGYYQGADITDVEKKEIDIVLEYATDTLRKTEKTN